MSADGARPKRVWQRARSQRRDDGWAIMLDDKPLLLPSGAELLIPEAPLAEAVAAEWDAEWNGNTGGTDVLRLTPLAAARQERVAPHRSLVIDHLLGFLDGDGLRYRAEPGSGLRLKQDRLWDPWMAYWETRTGCRLTVATGVMPMPSDAVATAGAAAWLAAIDDAQLTVLAFLVPVLGSLVLGLAVVEHGLDGRDALALSLLDEHDQRARWGTVAEGEARDAALDAEIGAATRFLGFCVGNGGGHGG